MENVNPDELINAKDLAKKLNSLTAKGLTTSELDMKRTRDLDNSMDFQKTNPDHSFSKDKEEASTTLVESESSKSDKRYTEMEEEDYFSSFLN